MKRKKISKTAGALHGFEKEGIRITPDGRLSQTPHPESLGSSLMHAYITTDFAEPQLEFRTPPSGSLFQALQVLKEIHVYTAKTFDGELIWPFSMPPELPEKEADIPLAVYGTSAAGKQKTVYRRGIGARYGRKRLTISGVHYNFSMDTSGFNDILPDDTTSDNAPAISDCYLHIIRNLYRKISYLTYLFGASPAFDKSLDPPGLNRFKRHKSATYYGEHATSLRASDIGYTSRVQDGLSINFNSCGDYINSLHRAVSTCNPDYLEISNRPAGQLNPNFLQAEYELYAPFRPKPLPAVPGEGQFDALKQKGVGYIELRLPDIDPGHPEGIDLYTMGFLHLSMVDCLINVSPPLFATELKDINSAHREIIWNGRKLGAMIPWDGGSRPFHDSGRKYCEGLYGLAEKLDGRDGSDFYQASLHRQVNKWNFPELTPSGKHLSDLLDNNRDFVESGIKIADENRRYFKSVESDPGIQGTIEAQTGISVKLQHELEAVDSGKADNL
jgi:glutamate--cysteine ligase